MRPLSHSAIALSVVSMAAAGVASLVTLAWSGSFPAPGPGFNDVLFEARGWSAATLALALPGSALSLIAARRGSLRGRLAWLGGLVYLLYTYLEMAVSPPFTALYLVYVAAFACAIPALAMGAALIDLDELQAAFADRAPRRTVAAVSFAVAAFLALAWLRGIVVRTLAGDFGWPQGEAAVGHVVHALDLGLQVPLCIAAGAMLLLRRRAGSLLAGIMLVNAVYMGAALTSMVACSAASAGGSALQAAPFALAWMLSAAAAAMFFRAARQPVAAVTRSDQRKSDAAASELHHSL